MKFEAKCKGTCARAVSFEIEEGKVKNVEFYGGCHGNQQGIASLAEGLDAKILVEKLDGINCGGKGTSCPDQLAKAVAQAIESI